MVATSYPLEVHGKSVLEKNYTSLVQPDTLSREEAPESSIEPLTLDDYYKQIESIISARNNSMTEKMLKHDSRFVKKIFTTLRVISEHYIDTVKTEYLIDIAIAALKQHSSKEIAKLNETMPTNTLNHSSKYLINRFVTGYEAFFSENRELDTTTIENVLDEIVKSIDPKGKYYTRETIELLQASQEKMPIYATGIALNQRIIVVGVRPGSNAYKAGLRFGDQILEIDQKSKYDLEDSTLMYLRGPENSNVNLKIKQNGKTKTIIFDRETVDTSVVAQRLDNNIAYIGLTKLTHQGLNEVIYAILNFRVNKKGRILKGMILDLRFNSGGSLNVPIQIVDLFIDEGQIASINARKENLNFHSEDLGLYSIYLPLVVLVNGATASGAEIIVSALKVLRGAIVVGTKTAGIGKISSILEAADKDKLKITTGEILTADGRHLEGQGIDPDYCISFQGQKMVVKPQNQSNSTCESKVYISEKENKQILSFAINLILANTPPQQYRHHTKEKPVEDESYMLEPAYKGVPKSLDYKPLFKH
jgi:C-terminal peptidase prc